MGVLGIFFFGLVSLNGFLGELWHQFWRMRLHNVLSGQTDAGPERAAVQGVVGD